MVFCDLKELQGEGSAKWDLLDWVRTKTHPLPVTNFGKDWSDGRVL
jgi:hypothetical protein